MPSNWIPSIRIIHATHDSGYLFTPCVYNPISTIPWLMASVHSLMPSTPGSPIHCIGGGNNETIKNKTCVEHLPSTNTVAVHSPEHKHHTELKNTETEACLCT